MFDFNRWFGIFWLHKLKKIKLPESLNEIDESAFAGCKRLKEIKFSKNLTEIGEDAFDNCDSLKKITYYKCTEYILYKYFGSKWDSLEKFAIYW